MKIKKDDLSVGMRFSRPLFFEDGVNMFLDAGQPVLQKHLDCFDDWQVKFLTTEGGQVSDDCDDAVEELCEIDEEPVHAFFKMPDSPLSRLATISDDVLLKHYFAIIERVILLFNSLIAERTLGAKPEVESVADSLIAMSADCPLDLLHAVLIGRDDFSNFPKRAVDCAVLSCEISKRLGYGGEKLLFCVEGALMHDVGMFQFVPELAAEHGRLSSEKFAEVMTHVIDGYNFLSNVLHFEKEVADCARFHHESFDGNGYMDGIAGDAIPDCAAVVRLSDCFGTLISERTYRHAISGSRAFDKIVQGRGTMFSPRVVDAFVAAMNVYPKGTLAWTTHGDLVQSTGADPSSPLNPALKILRKGKRDSVFMQRYGDDDALLRIDRALTRAERIAFRSEKLM